MYFIVVAIRCPRLRRPNYGEIYPGDCTRARKYFGTRCAFSCHAGFQLQGPSLRECVAPGRWNGGNLMTRCVGRFIAHANQGIIAFYQIIMEKLFVLKALLLFYRYNTSGIEMPWKYYFLYRWWFTLRNIKYDNADYTRY